MFGRFYFMFKLKYQMSDTILIGGLLAFAGGFMDAYSYLVRGEVFANAQTGNIVLLGINLFRLDASKCILYLIPIVSFTCGIIIAEYIKSKFKENTFIHWRQIIVLTEIVVLFLVGFIPQGNLNTIANVLISFVCSLQVQSFRKVKGLACATTMCTGNLRSATENFFKYKSTKDKTFLLNSFYYYLIIVIFILGAIFGALCSSMLLVKSIWIASFTSLIAFLFMLLKPEDIA